MKLQLANRQLIWLVILTLLMSSTSAASNVPASIMSQSALTLDQPGELSPVVEYANNGGVAVEPFVQPATQLGRQDYQNVYNAAMQLLQQATSFRANELQLGTAETCAGLQGKALSECLNKNYKDFNSGRLFYRFCASFEPQSAIDPAIKLDLSSVCQNWDQLNFVDQQARVTDITTKPLVESPDKPVDVRNRLLLARDYFGFLALGPAEQQINQGDVRVLGKTGVLSATREIANVHLIFGTEFLVDATNYRFSGAINPTADNILQSEIKRLKFAVQQFQLGVDVLAYAFNADFGGPGGKRIGDFFGDREYELFNTMSERMIDSLSELALRYRQLGQEQQALKLYADAFRDQYVQSLAIADSARKNGPSFLQNGGWRLMNNLEHLRARAQAIYDHLNPFGFPPEYVPLQSYTDLRNTTIGNNGQAGLLQNAQNGEEKAQSANREFDQNRTVLATELQGLRLTYEAKLLEMCGQQTDYAAACDGGLMKRNYFDMIAALNEVKLAYEGMEQIPAQIEIEQQRAGRVINLILEGGRQVSAIEHARGILNYETTTDAVANTNTFDLYGGVEARVTASVCICFPITGGVEASLSVFGGTRWSKTHTSSTQTTINYNAIALGQLNSLQALEQATNQASVEGANSEATIKGLLLQQVSKLIQYDLAINRYNQVAAEHNALVDQYHLWLNLWNQAQDNLADSYLNNPAYRIMRDHWTVESSRSFNLAAQFVYLTAKAAEYDLLEPYPDLKAVFKARTTGDLNNFLIDLDTWYHGKLTPGALNRFPYRISMTCDVLHLYDQNLNPDPKLCREQSPDVRFAQFQNFLQQHLLKDTTGKVIGLEFPFATSLVDNNIFSPSIWNNRIAGVNTPLQQSNGLAINLYVRQLGNIGQPEVILIHNGHTTYRKNDGSIVYYAPNTAQPIGWGTPDSLKPKSTTGVVLATLNGDFTNTGQPTSAFLNLSVAASNWVLKIDLTSPRNVNLDLSQIEDIEIIMDTTGIARSGMEQQAQVEAAQLQSAYDAVVR